MTFKNITHLKILQKYRSQHLSFLKGDGPKFKGMLRRQDMIFVDIIILVDIKKINLMQILLNIYSYHVLLYLSIHQFAWWAIDCTVNQGYTNPTVGYFFNISKCKYWYIKLLVGYQYPRSGSWLIGIRYLNIVTFRQYLKFRNSVSNRSFWPCF